MIKTKYLKPTTHRGSRVKATFNGQSVTLGYDHGLSPEGNHVAAASALCNKLGLSPDVERTEMLKAGFVFVAKQV